MPSPKSESMAFTRGAGESATCRTANHGARALGALALAFAAAGFGGCVTETETLADRASNEFICPRERVNLLARDDIAPGLYDVEACGQRARYSCVGGRRHVPRRCVHEPDPAKWDPDPAFAAHLPALDPLMPSDVHAASVCARGGVETTDCDCLGRSGSSWSWRRCEAASTASSGREAGF